MFPTTMADLEPTWDFLVLAEVNGHAWRVKVLEKGNGMSCAGALLNVRWTDASKTRKLHLHLHPLSVLNHRVDYSDTGNGRLAQKQKKKQTNKQTKPRPTGGACELLTWKRQETWFQQQLRAASHSSPGWFVAGMSAFDSSLGTGLEQVGLNVLVYLSLLVLVILAPGSYGVFQNPPGPCCLRSYTSWWTLQFFADSVEMSIQGGLVGWWRWWFVSIDLGQSEQTSVARFRFFFYLPFFVWVPDCACIYILILVVPLPYNYAVSLSLMLLTFRFLRRKPSILLALVVRLWTWRSQSRSCTVVTPRYFAEVTLARVWLCNWYDGLSSFFVLMGLMTGRVVHFPGWKDISQFFSHVSSCWRSFCICVWSWPVVIGP